MRILKSIFAGIFLCSPAFFATSDVLDRSSQDMSQGALGSGVIGQQSSVQSASGIGSGMIFGTDEKEREATADLLSFTAGGHVLGFRKGRMLIASGDHALRVEFMNAREVSPEEKTAVSIPEKNPRVDRPLGRVAYNELWDGVNLVYENDGGGVVKSRYLIESSGTKEADPVDRIGLRYNVPVRVDEAGDLILLFKTGEMRESRPVAWQEIEGRRVPVEVTYHLRGEQEVGFKTGGHDSRYPLAIELGLSWNTFWGGAGEDHGYGIAVDTIGNVYLTGYSDATWGSPIRPYSGKEDAFVAKLDAGGNLQWNTFLGGNELDEGWGIAVDTIGNVYVTGWSDATWGSPVLPYSYFDDFVAKLDTYGNLQWNTFLAAYSSGYGIAVDSIGNIYVTGYSFATWGSPIRPYSGEADAYVAKLNNNGTLRWNVFLGGSGDDYGEGIAVDTIGNVYVTGEGNATWGSPVRPYSGDIDAFVAKLDASGTLQWNTFLGGAGDDYGEGIAVDTTGNVYVTGDSQATWGSPIRPYSVQGDAFVAKLNAFGALYWNTFLGGPSYDHGYGIAVDTIGNIYVAGDSKVPWGLPVRFYSGNYDAFVANLNDNGALRWNAFLGGTGEDDGVGITLDMIGNIYVTGSSFATWGSPIRAFGGGADGFVAKIKAGYYLTISSGPHGATNPAPGRYLHKEGSTASVSAIPDSAYVFDRWTGDVPAGQETSATVSILMNAEKSIRANFKAGFYLTIASGPHGTTNPVPGTYFYDAGNTASISAIPDSECVFDNWTGDVPAGQETSATISIPMNAQKSIRANFRIVSPPSNLMAVRLTNRSVTQTEYIVDLTWAANPANDGLNIAAYRVYRKEGDSWVKLADLSSTGLGYRVRNVPKAEQTFGVTSVTDGGVESAKTTVVK
ncbi:MAG: SBBP repeat-containing protein [Candidatus Aminicenantes bacterium]|nr:SBBP repeat-containing protein [Candidatus Aminicenantes bacterium]